MDREISLNVKCRFHEVSWVKHLLDLPLPSVVITDKRTEFGMRSRNLEETEAESKGFFDVHPRTLLKEMRHLLEMLPVARIVQHLSLIHI